MLLGSERMFVKDLKVSMMPVRWALALVCVPGSDQSPRAMASPAMPLRTAMNTVVRVQVRAPTTNTAQHAATPVPSHAPRV